MALTRRYRQPHYVGPQSYGMDLSTLVPEGMEITAAGLAIQQNTNPPTNQTDLTASPVYIRGRQVFAVIDGGVTGTDYILTWSASDNRGNTWYRSATLLCSYTS